MNPNKFVVTDREDGYLTVNEVPTHIVTYGGWLDTLQDVKEKKMAILIIPGNPGMIDYYHLFMETIYEGLEGKFPVIGISHAGHVQVPDFYRIPKLSGNEHLYSINGQIKHKLQFIEDYIPENIPLILIGHSIGSYISLHLMNLLPKHRILKSILLFPTVERMAETPNGKWAVPILSYARPLILIFIYILSYLSTPMQYNLLEWFFSKRPSAVPPCVYTASLNVLDVHCTNKWMYMAKTEMERVSRLDLDLVENNLSKLIFYYGAKDQWAPVSYYENMKELFPDGDIRLCDKEFDHAFVLHSSVQLANMVVGWICQ